MIEIDVKSRFPKDGLKDIVTICETCIHEDVCMYRGDFTSIYVTANNDKYRNIFDVSCNEYKESESFKRYMQTHN